MVNNAEKPRLHKSVLTHEVLEYLDPQPHKTYLDVTFGTGGHTSAILDADPNCQVIAMDWDNVALDTYGPALQQKYGDRLQLIWGNFALLYKILKQNKITQVDGVLADFGTSQIQIANRPGFSVYKESLLDMRMSPPHQQVTAGQLIQKATEEKLREIFWQLGQEAHAKQIARAIIQERQKGRNALKTTTQLAALIEKTVPVNKKKRIHPATQVFQALRLYVNRELNNIDAFLPMALQTLTPAGKLVCISFHSLEDRIVKEFFKEQEAKGKLEILTPRVVIATKEEVAENPSSRSAKLRAAKRI